VLAAGPWPAHSRSLGKVSGLLTLLTWPSGSHWEGSSCTPVSEKWAQLLSCPPCEGAKSSPLAFAGAISFDRWIVFMDREIRIWSQDNISGQLETLEAKKTVLFHQRIYLYFPSVCSFPSISPRYLLFHLFHLISALMSSLMLCVAPKWAAPFWLVQLAFFVLTTYINHVTEVTITSISIST